MKQTTLQDHNEIYNNQETEILIRDMLEEEEGDEYWQEIQER